MRIVIGWLRLSLIFLWELGKSIVPVAKAVFSPRPTYAPAIIAVPLDLRGDGAIALLANLVSLTPGTTSIHVSEDRRSLFVHALDADCAERAAAEIKATFERRIKEVLS